MTRIRGSLSLAVMLALLALACTQTPCRAINIVIDYSYDVASTNFFGAGNPSGAAAGAQAKASLQAAASFYSGILTDTFSSIIKPADFHSSVFDGSWHWDWSLSFRNPVTAAETIETLSNVPIAADEYRIYVGARDLGDFTLGKGGPGGRGWSSSGSGSFTPAEATTISQANTTWGNTVLTRGETIGFARWGGSIAFDNRATTVWSYNYAVAPAAMTNDFYSVAIHEMGHALGLGLSDEWYNLATGSNFTGPAAAASYGSPPPLEPPSSGSDFKRQHWAMNTMSKILGTNTVQEAAMDPDLTQGTRKLLTALDAAAMTDIGWTVAAPTFDAADFNHDHVVNGGDLSIWWTAFNATPAGDADGDGDSDGADLLLWQRQLGHTTPMSAAASGAVPEPTTLALGAASAAMFALGARRRRYAASSGRVWAA